MSTMDDLRNQIAEDDGSLPERWNPDDAAGTTLVGVLRRYEAIVTDYGESRIAVIEDEGGTEWGVALFRSVLKKRFETLDPQPGDTIGLKYVGFQEPRTKGANGYHNYVMRVLRASGQTALAADARTPADGGPELPW